MGTLTIAQICDAIATTLSAATGLTRTESYDELTSGMNTLPTLQVYWEATDGDVSGDTDRTTFSAGRRTRRYTIHADLYARQRAQIGEDMAKVVAMQDAVEAELDKQKEQLFGLSNNDCKAVKWTAMRVIFNYGDPNINYIGARFVILIYAF